MQVKEQRSYVYFTIPHWLISLNIIFSKFTQLFENETFSFFKVKQHYTHTHNLLYLSSVGTLMAFILATLSNAAINIGIQTFL